jgi:hypothetical protein
MEVTLLGITMLAKELHRENASSPMEVTLLGITVFVRELHI